MFKDIDRRTYSAKPFWAWNGDLKKSELLRQIQIMRQMGFGGFFMHSRTGLQTEYLGTEWFDLINSCADNAAEVNMESWLYDEDRWPSGSAGGIATKDKKFRMQYIRMNIVLRDSFEWSDDILCAFAANVNELDFTDCLKISGHTDIKVLDTTHILYFTNEFMLPTPTYNGSAYLDTLNKDATEYYISTTHEKYKKYCGERLGKSIQGIFTDEPHRGALMSGFSVPNHDPQYLCPYTTGLFDEFEKAYGYDLRDRLPELFLRHNGKKYAKVKWQYTELLLKLFLDNFAKPYYKWCKENNLKVTGHVLHEDTPSCQTITNGSVMRYYEYMDYPGVDVLTEYNNCYCIVKQLSSAARQLDKKWLLSELNGCTGWQMTFQDYKGIGDWQAIMGINLRCPHLSWYTMEGEAKRDYPASILHQSSWYKTYHFLEDYYARIAQITTNSKRICQTAVIMPVESVWVQIHAGWAKDMQVIDGDIQEIDKLFADTYMNLLHAHVDFDYADEEMLSRLYRIEDHTLWIGHASYKRIIVSGMITIRKSTLEVLKAFKKAGGEVIFVSTPPILVDASESEEAIQFAKECLQMQTDDLKKLSDKIEISSPQILLQTYQDNNHTYYFLLNENRTTPVQNVSISFGEEICLQEWNPIDGEKQSIKVDNGLLTTQFAAGQLKLFVDCSESIDIVPEQKNYVVTDKEYAQNNIELTLDEPNILVLDYASWQINDEEIQDPEEVLQIDRHIRKRYNLEPRGGEMYQPWYLKTQTTENKCNLSLYYSFEINTTLSSPIYLMLEEPHNFEITINGMELHEKFEDDIFVDICFHRVDISNYLSNGINTICLATMYNDFSNIESIYILGDFGVSLPDKAIIPMQNHYRFESLTQQGLPFYGGKINYRIYFTKQPQKDEQAILHLKKLENNACYEVNGTLVGFEPYECDITESLQNGNYCDVSVYLTRRNTFGPLHGVPKKLNAVGPMHFLGGADKDYVLYDSGLTEKPWVDFRKVIEGDENV